MLRPSTNQSRSEYADKGTPQKNGTGGISDLFDKNILAYLERIFSESESQHNALTTQEFRQLLVKYIPLNLVDSIYRSIDVNDVGYINYSDFTNYLIASEEGSAFSSKTYVSRLVMHFEQEEENFVTHRDMIDCMAYVKKPCAMIITGGRDGQVSLWHAESLELITHIQHRAKNSVYEEDLHSRMDKVLKAKVIKMAVSQQRRQAKVAITALCPLLGGSGLLCVGSADACITVYDIATQDVIGRYPNLENVPTSMECFYRKQSFHFTDTTTTTTTNNNTAGHDVDLPVQHIAIGDAVGGMTIIKLHVEFGLSTEVGMKKKNQILFAQSILEGCTKYQPALNWITQMHFVVEADALILASTDGSISFFDIARGAVVRSFDGHAGTKTGVKSFAWSHFGKYVVSGADRTLLFWDLFTLETVYKIEDLKSPVVYVDVQDEQNKLFAILVNKTIHVWHNITYEVLQTVTDESVYKPLNVLSAMVFSPDLKMLFTAGNRITAWTLERATDSQGANESHEDLTSVLYNNTFNQVVMVKSLGLVKIYQAETGEIVRQFSVLPLNRHTGNPMELRPDPHTGQYAPVIKQASFDKMQSRLIVTSQDRSVQFWNLNDGSPLIQVSPQLYSTTLAHLYANLPKAISATSYETLSSGTGKRVKKLLLVGTEHGHLCGYQESQSLVEECPVFFLRLSDFAPMEHVVKTAAVTEVRKAKLNTLVSGLVQHQRAGSTQLNAAEDLEGLHHPGGKSKHSHGETPSGSEQDAHAHAPAHPHVDPNSSLASPRKIHTLAHTTAQELMHHSTEHSVLWMELIEHTHVLMVGYLHGLVALWDLDKHHRLHDLPMRQYGPILMCMRSKDFLKQQHLKQQAGLSRFKKPVFHESILKAPPALGAEAAGNEVNKVGNKNEPSEATASSSAPLDKTINGKMTPDRAGSPTTNPRRSLHVGSGSIIPASPGGSPKNMSPKDSRKSLFGRHSRSNSMDSTEDSRAPEQALPKLNFSRPGEMAPPKLLTGTRTRKASVLKVSAQKIGALRRASALLQVPPEGIFAPGGFSPKLSSKSSPKGSPKGSPKALVGKHARPVRPRTQSMGESSDDDNRSGTESSQAFRKPSQPALSNEQWNPDGTMKGYFAAPVAVARPTASSRHRDSASMVVANGESFMGRFKRVLSNNNATAPHRKLSVALNPQQQYGKTSALEGVSQAESVATLGSVASLPAKARPSIGGDPLRATAPQLRHGSCIVNNSVFAQTAAAPISAPLSIDTLLGESLLQQDSVMSLGEPSAAMLMESSTASVDSSLNLGSFTNSIEQSSENTGSNPSGQAEQSKIVVDSLIVLPQAQVIVGACSDRYIRFWDLETHHILCSCLYYHAPEHHHEDHNNHDHEAAPVVSLAAVSSAVPAKGAPAHSASVSASHDRGHHAAGKGAQAASQPGSTASAHLNPHHNMVTQPTKVNVSALKATLQASLQPPLDAQGQGHAEQAQEHHHHRHHHGHHHGHGHHHQHHKHHKHEAPPDEVLRVLKVSDSEDLLIGAYDTGMIRTWSIQSYSLVTLKGLLNKYLASVAAAAALEEARHEQENEDSPRRRRGPKKTNTHPAPSAPQQTKEAEKIDSHNPFGSAGHHSFGAMAISPITLLHEWLAHKSPFISVDYVWFDPTPVHSDEPTSTNTVHNSMLICQGQSTKVSLDKNISIRGPGSPSRRVSMFSSSAKHNAPAGNNADNGSSALSAKDPFGAEDNTSAKIKAQRGISMKDKFDSSVSSARMALQQLTTADAHEALAKLELQAQRPKRMKNSDMGNDILEGFILSAGLDQRVLLWNLQGKCVGEFGSYGWEIDNEATWYKGQNEKIKRSKHKTKKQPAEADLAAHYARETAARNITKETVNLVRSPSSILIQNIGKHAHHTSKELNDYVEALSRKISNKPPVYLDEDAHFSSIMTNHPIVETSRKKGKKYVQVRHKSED